MDGGGLVEGRYLLGMLLGTNLFRFDTQGYLRELHMYISTQNLRAGCCRLLQ